MEVQTMPPTQEITSDVGHKMELKPKRSESLSSKGSTAPSGQGSGLESEGPEQSIGDEENPRHSSIKALFTPTICGGLHLQNRIVYPAMSRGRFTHQVANEHVIEYYRARASAGLIVMEPSAVCPEAVGFPNAPALYTQEHISSWSRVIGAVRGENKSATVVAQLWHTGRVGHSSFGHAIVAPSAIKIEDSPNRIRSTGVQGSDMNWHPHEEPREMTLSEIEYTIEQFAQAACLAKKAGFDGIEIHAGSGYLIDTFLQPCSNNRVDDFGGSAEKRFTFLREIIKRITSGKQSHLSSSQSFAPFQIGVKLTPNNGFNGMGHGEIHADFLYYIQCLAEMGIGYIHVTDGIGTITSIDEPAWFGRINSAGFHGLSAPVYVEEVRKAVELKDSAFAYTTAVIANGGYTGCSGAEVVKAKQADAISFGRVYMANPDLVERLKNGQALADLPPKTMWFEASKDLGLAYSEYSKYGKQ
jgi:2,4-dienoyl-CoA reductase-like NADH-dependent reductase (Old Yellow Enzyme family)